MGRKKYTGYDNRLEATENYDTDENRTKACHRAYRYVEKADDDPSWVSPNPLKPDGHAPRTHDTRAARSGPPQGVALEEPGGH